jgi:hypothetical protein
MGTQPILGVITQHSKSFKNIMTVTNDLKGLKFITVTPP